MNSMADKSRDVPVLPRLPRRGRAVQMFLPLVAADRRTGERRPFEAAVREFGGRPLGQAQDLCPSGMRLLRRGGAQRPLPVRSPLTVSFCLPDGERVRVGAEVVFDRLEEGSQRAHVTGLRFAALSPALEQRLRALLQ